MNKLNPKKPLLGILAISVVLIVTVLILRSGDNNQVSVEVSKDVTPAVPSSETAVPKDITSNAAAGSDTQHSPPLEASTASGQTAAQQNIQTMTQVLFDYLSPNRKATDLLFYLKQSGQEPYTSTSSNPDTGGMMFVRTKKPFAGTRYFHAQYVEGENGSIVPQHMSFEFMPGPRAMEIAEEALRTIKPQLGEPHERTENFISWKLEDGYHCYIAKLDAEYIKEHPFNAYSPEDVGTIKIAVEMDIHP